MRRSPVSSGWKEVASSGPCRTATIRHLGNHVGVVVEGDCLDDRGGAARRVADLKMPSAAAGVDLRLITATGTWLAEAEQAGLGDRDYTAMLKTILRGRDNGPSCPRPYAPPAPRTKPAGYDGLIIDLDGVVWRG